MAAIDDITELAQDVYYTVNKTENDVVGADLTTFQNEFIRAFNLWAKEFETEADWNKARVNDYVLATVANVTTFSFTLPDDFRTPVFDINKELKFINDGVVIARFVLVNPNQRQVDDENINPNRATFIPVGDSGGTVVISRVPTTAEIGSTIVLDVVRNFPKLTRTDTEVFDYLYNSTVTTLGIAKNEALSDLTKVSLSPSFAQKYKNELDKAIMVNSATNAVDDMRMDDFSSIGSF